MRSLPGICRRLAPLAIIFCCALAFGCDDLAAGQTLWIRLSAPISSYTSKAGDTVHAVLTESVMCGNEVIFPVGTNIDGVVHSVRKVGWGIRHETAALDIRFDRALVTQDPPISISTSIVEVENAREQVNSKGVIQGIRSSDTPQGPDQQPPHTLADLEPLFGLGADCVQSNLPHLSRAGDLLSRRNRPAP